MSLRTGFSGACRAAVAAALLSMSGAAWAGVQPETCPAEVDYAGPAPSALAAPPGAATHSGRPMEAATQETARALANAFAEYAGRTDAGAAAVAVWSPELGYWAGDYGVEQGGDAPTLWWASVGKLATASIILQLAGEDRLSLDDPIAAWFPDFPGADAMTVDHLLTHTGGVFSFNADRRVQEDPGYRSPEALIDIAAGHGLDFCPGANWNYSNTGYLMLGLIAEQVDGAPLARIVQRRIAAPLGLDTLRLAVRGEAGPSVPPGDATGADEIAAIGGAGAMLASAPDMLGLMRAWMEGRLVSPQARDAALGRLYPMFGEPMRYGRGVMAIDVPDPDAPTLWLGHLGGAPGGKGVLIYDIERQIYMALAMDRQAPAEAVANGLLKMLDGIDPPAAAP